MQPIASGRDDASAGFRSGLCHQNRSSAAAFTVLELLVGVVILAILLGLFLSVLGSIRANARQAVCSSNLRQMGQALVMYASDNSDRLPYPTLQVTARSCWFHAIDPYLLRMLPPGSGRNVSDVKQDPIWQTLSGSGTASTIKMNKKLALSSATVSNISSYVIKSTDVIRFSQFPQSSRTVLLFDGRARDSHPTATADHSRFDGWEAYVYPRHRGRANVLFVDGHVEWRSETLDTPNQPKNGWLSNGTSLTWWGK